MPARVGGKRKRNLRKYLIERDGPFCGECGKPGYTNPEMRGDPMYLTVGHLKSHADGGPMSRSNTRLEHADCNIKRGTEPLHVTARKRAEQ